jgi:hypothetical protein
LHEACGAAFAHQKQPAAVVADDRGGDLIVLAPTVLAGTMLEWPEVTIGCSPAAVLVAERGEL